VVPHDVDEGFGVSVQVLVPLHTELMQAVGAQVTVVPVQLAPMQASLKVHRSPSSQAAEVRQAHVPPALVQRRVEPPQLTVWHGVWVAAVQVCVTPPEQMPSAPAEPQPMQDWPTVSMFAVQISAQAPSVVRQPPVAALHPAWQHWLPPPTPQVVSAAVHVQALHTSPVPLQYRVQVFG
jgi:hypothetical protein